MKKAIFIFAFILFCSVTFSYAADVAVTPDKNKVELTAKTDDTSKTAEKEEGKKAKVKETKEKAAGCCESKKATTGCSEQQKKSCAASKKACSETKSSADSK